MKKLFLSSDKKMRQISFQILAAVLLAAPLVLAGNIAAGEKSPKSLPKVDLTMGVKIPLRDGVKLHAAVYKPQGMAKPRPAIVTITPYMADSYHDRAMYFAQKNYVFIIADCRGRGNSGGEFEPFANEGKDGYDVVEWAAKQKWCNGNVGMWGGSYAGFNQWATLKENPPHLKTIVPVASAHPGVDLPAMGGIMDTYFLRWLIFTSGKIVNKKLFSDELYWIAKYRRRFLDHAPFCELDRMVGAPNRHFQNWLKHRTPDAYWDAMAPSKSDYEKFEVPVLTVTGQYDGDQPGAMEYYHRHMKYGSEKGKKKHYVIMGPWDHPGTREPKLEMGGLTFAKASLMDLNKLHRMWYDWTLDDGFKPVILTRRFSYFVSESGRWKSVNHLDDISSERRNFYLHSDGRANDVFHSGKLLRDQPGKQPPDRFRYDPLDVRPAELESEIIKNPLTDQRYALNLFGSGAIYHTPPFAEPVEITGYMKFVAWMKLNVPDADFLVRVYEIRNNGESIFLGQDRLRARYRQSLRKPKLIKPGQVNRYEFKHFFFMSRQIKKGSRLRLVVRCPNSIFWEKNYNSGGAVENETAKDARTAEVELLHDQDHLSYLEVPMVKVGVR